MNPICDTPVVTVPTKTIKEIGKIYNKNIFNTAPNISRMAYKNGLFSESIVVLTNPTISTKKLMPYKEKNENKINDCTAAITSSLFVTSPFFFRSLSFLGVGFSVFSLINHAR